MISQEIWQKVSISREAKAEKLLFLFFEHTDFFYSQVVDFRKKNITYYDSMGGINNEACRILL